MLDEINALFDNAPVRTLAANKLLFRTGSEISSIFLVENGCIALERHLENGAVTSLQRARSGELLAEASVYSHNYHCDARAIEPTSYRALSAKTFRRALLGDAALAEMWAKHLARTVQATRFLSELRGMRTVAERLDAWLAEHGALPDKGQWKSLAAELAVSPEALYRELSQRI